MTIGVLLTCDDGVGDDTMIEFGGPFQKRGRRGQTGTRLGSPS
jgi:hypothetical protein